ncbi:MAG: hypothetical protein ACYDDF_13610 [Thermoplasmatota archaeon]
MLTARLVGGVVLNLLIAGSALWIGQRFWRGARDHPERRALTSFAVWWLFLGVDNLINEATWLAGGLDITYAPLYAALTFAALASIGVMLWGIVSYILFLFTGKMSVVRAVTIFYVVQVLLAAGLIAYLQPTGAAVVGWGGQVTYAIPPPPWAALFVALFFLLPPILCAVAYGTLFFRTKEKPQRRRIAFVSGGITAWFLGSLLATASGSNTDMAVILGLVLSLACMFAVARAYTPWPAIPPPVVAPTAPPSAFESRIRELV